MCFYLLINILSGQSRFNMIERGFSSLTPKLADLTLDREGKVVTKHNAKDHWERLNVETVVQAMEIVKDACEGHTYDGYEWETIVRDPREEYVSINGKDMYNREHRDHTDITNFYNNKKPRNKMTVEEQEKHDELLAESEWINDHGDTRGHCFFLTRCEPGDGCCKDCKAYHKRNNTPFDIFRKLNLPTKHRNGANFYTPTSSEEDPTHNLTYIQQSNMLEINPDTIINPDHDIDIDRCQVKLNIFNLFMYFDANFF